MDISKKMSISKGKIIVYAIILAIAWSYILTNFIDVISTQPFWLQFVLASALGYLFPALIIGHAFEKEINKKIVGTWLFIMSSDLVLPPLLISFEGKFAATTLGMATPDYLLFELWKSIGMPAEFLFFAIYPLSFVLLIIVATWLLTEKQLWQLAKNGW